MNRSSDHDVTALPGDCLTEVPADQKDREAAAVAAEVGDLFHGAMLPDDVVMV